MSVAKRIITPLCLSTLAVLIACGGSSSTTPTGFATAPTNSSGGAADATAGEDSGNSVNGNNSSGSSSGGSSSGSSSGNSNGCPSSCSTDNDCQSCNAAPSGQSNCCMGNACYMYMGGSCPSGASDAGSTE
jgi:hypothetical protein